MFNRPKCFDPNLFDRTVRGIESLDASYQRNSVLNSRSLCTILIEQCEGTRNTGKDREESQIPSSKVEVRPSSTQLPMSYVTENLHSVKTAQAELSKSTRELRSYLAESFSQLEAVLNEKLRVNALAVTMVVSSSKREENRAIMVAELRSQNDRLREYVRNSSPDLCAMLSESVVNITRQTQDTHRLEIEKITERLRDETAQRRKLHNLVQDLKGCVRVFARIRPFLPFEVSHGARSCISAISDTELVLTRSGTSRKFTFDRVFDQNSVNGDLCNEVQQLLISSLDGFNVAVLTYGITGSGKSYTMQGLFERVGLDLFEQKASRERIGGWKHQFQLAVYEIYNDTIIDLLNLRNIDTGIRLDPRTGHFHIPGITKALLGAPADVDKNLREATRNRSVSSTNCNEQSSRSHLITSFFMQISTPSGAEITSKLSLVDLAGSERLDKSGASGSTAKEAVHINKSLSALGDVIHARLHKASYIPYRNSVLTSALQDCISGDSKTLILLQLSPNDESVDETSNCVGFGTRIRELETFKGPSSPRRR